MNREGTYGNGSTRDVRKTKQQWCGMKGADEDNARVYESRVKRVTTVRNECVWGPMGKEERIGNDEEAKRGEETKEEV